MRSFFVSISTIVFRRRQCYYASEYDNEKRFFYCTITHYPYSNVRRVYIISNQTYITNIQNGSLMKDNSDSSKKCEIKLKNIKKTYVMGEVKVPVLHGIDLEIYKGEITVILGASGSGKTTLMNIIGGIENPTEGEIWFDKKDLAKLKDKQLTQYRRNNIGFIFQFYNLIPTLSSKENVEVSTQISSNPMDPIEALKLVDMEEKIDHFPSQMSGGQQQRVSIARALAKNPTFLLCDEPTGALDFKTGQLVLETLVNLNKKLETTIVIITHNASLADLAHRVVHLGSGIIEKSAYNKKRLSVEEIVW